MNRRDTRVAGAALALLCAAAGAHAQDVHKCSVNGQVVYQAQACPANDVVLQAAPTPSEQETRQAQNELWRQRMQAASGRIARPVYVPPPAPPPPPPPRMVMPSTTTTTVIMEPAGGGRVIIHQTTRTPAQVVYPSDQKPLNNCEKLNRDNGELLDRREQLRAPGELATRGELLRKAETDLAHVQDMAKASNCKLAR